MSENGASGLHSDATARRSPANSGAKAAKKVLITGSTGLLGVSLIRNRPPSVDIYAGYFNFPAASLPKSGVLEFCPFDMRDRGGVLNVFKRVRPDVVIHTASLGNVDYCENNKEEAWNANVEGARAIMEGCRQSGARMIFTSSNAVFDGKLPPYAEGAKPNPVDYYGFTKLQTEVDLSESGIIYSVARLMTMYGWNHPLERQNPVTWLLSKASKNERVNIVDDIYNNHLFVDNAAAAIWAILAKGKEGIYHIAGNQTVSRYELACMVADVFGFDKGFINPVNSSFFPSIAPRPRDTSYDILKMEKDLGVRAMGIKEGLTIMKNNPPQEWEYARR